MFRLEYVPASGSSRATLFHLLCISVYCYAIANYNMNLKSIIVTVPSALTLSETLHFAHILLSFVSRDSENEHLTLPQPALSKWALSYTRNVFTVRCGLAVFVCYVTLYTRSADRFI